MPAPQPPHRHHIYCSPSNAGAAELMTEVSDTLDLKVMVADDVAVLHECGCMLVYLNGLTGKGVHVVTTSDYHSQRDSEWICLLYTTPSPRHSQKSSMPS